MTDSASQRPQRPIHVNMLAPGMVLPAGRPYHDRFLGWVNPDRDLTVAAVEPNLIAGHVNIVTNGGKAMLAQSTLVLDVESLVTIYVEDVITNEISIGDLIHNPYAGGWGVWTETRRRALDNWPSAYWTRAFVGPVLLCDTCIEVVDGIGAAVCQDGCALPVKHEGLCGRRPAARRTCSGCGETGRLHLAADAVRASR